jgi:hypothetical protein
MSRVKTAVAFSSSTFPYLSISVDYDIISFISLQSNPHSYTSFLHPALQLTEQMAKMVHNFDEVWTDEFDK